MLRTDAAIFFSDNHVEESLVLRFLYYAADQVVDLVYDYAAPAVSTFLANKRLRGDQLKGEVPPRDFRRLVFSSVQPVSVTWDHRLAQAKVLGAGDARGFKQIMPNGPHIVITYALLQLSPPGYLLRLRMPYCFEGAFSFIKLYADRKVGVAVKRADGKGWDYIDTATQEVFPFACPFNLDYAIANG